MKHCTALAWIITTLVVGGCARGPRNGSANQFTRLSFRVTLGDAVNPNYIYAIALRPLTAVQLANATTDNLGPIPVVTTGSRNGIVAGRPTRLVLYTPDQSQEGYLVYRFLNPPSDNTDPDPGVYSSPSEVITGSGLNPTADGYPNTLGFDITTQDLVDDSSTASSIVAIEFNILTMDRVALNASTSNRVMDALGDQRSTTTFNDYRRVLITTSGIYSNLGSNGQSSSSPEPADDVYNAPSGRFPVIDIVDWSLDVRPS